MYFPMDLKYNPTGKNDIDAERERRAEMLEEIRDGAKSSGIIGDEEEEFDASPSAELEAMLPFYNRVEDEALKIARKYFSGTFVPDCRDVHKQKLFEYELHGHTYRCYVDIFNENAEEINIIEVKATTNSKYRHRIDKDGEDKGLYFSDGTRGGRKFDLFVKDGNIWRFSASDSIASAAAAKSFEEKKKPLLDRYSDVGKYPHDLAFQRFVIEHVLRKAGDKRPVNFYLAVLNSEYVYDGARDPQGKCVYDENDGQELITFLDMNEVTENYQPIVLREIATLESYISTPHDVSKKVPVGCFCAWGKNTECVFWKHCFQKLRSVPDTNLANNYINFRGFIGGNIKDKYQLINEKYWKFDDVPVEWLTSENHKIQRDSYDKGEEWVDKKKMRYWFDQLKNNYPIYHFDFETFPCPLPRFHGEKPYRQSVFEFSLHIERAEGVCDKYKDNYIFLNENCDDDERENLVKAILDHFEFNEDGTLKGTMLAQNTSFERGRLEELAVLYPKYAKKLLAICDKSADLLDLLKTRDAFYRKAFSKTAKRINYYQRDLSGSYSIKKTLPVLVPELTYKGMDVGNGTQAYIAYVNYDSEKPTVFDNDKPMRTKDERRAALMRYCQQDTWAMVEILRAVRAKI